MMDPAWFERPDWPMDWELVRKDGLIKAIMDLRGADQLSDRELEQLGIMIFVAWESGQQAQQANNRPASLKASDAQLRKLAYLCDKLAEHIESMHRPAITTFEAEGGNIARLSNLVREAGERAGYAFGGIEVTHSGRGQPAKVAAAQVTEQVRSVYEHVTGGPFKLGTTHSDTSTTHKANEVTGDQVDFLKAVFEALRIDASANSQRRRK